MMEEMTGEPKQQCHHHRRVCFSFAAYAKTVVDHFRASGIPVVEGLSDAEFAAIEYSYGFEFPPDLRPILREGLPIGAGFPNWRSSSPQQLQVLVGLPVSGLLNEVSKGSFWCEAAWGPRPESSVDALSLAKGVLENAPVLVPIYRNFYIPSRPNLAGNPVFYVRGGNLRCSGFDLADFFQREEFKRDREYTPVPDPTMQELPGAPAWAAKSARRIDVWTELVDCGDGCATWRDESRTRGMRPELEKYLKVLGRKLREGGWRDEEVREMLMAVDGGDDESLGDRMVLRNRGSVTWHVRLLSLALLRAGWSTEDVAYSMGEGCTREDGRQLGW